jgi:transposase InsO family protein
MFDWIDVLYPRVHRHATLDYRSPPEFEAMTRGA